MNDASEFAEALDNFRSVVRDLATKAHELESALARLDAEPSEDGVKAVRTNQILLDEAYSRYGHVREVLFTVAGWA